MTSTTFQRILGGYIEHVGAAGQRISFWCNEEGKLQGLPVNRLATALWWDLSPEMERLDMLCGPVLITGGPTPDGQNTPVPTWMVEIYRRYKESHQAGD